MHLVRGDVCNSVPKCDDEWAADQKCENRSSFDWMWWELYDLYRERGSEMRPVYGVIFCI